jgi:hypothetical protein
MNAFLKMILVAAAGVLAPEAKAAFDSQMKPFLDKEIDQISSPDWHDIAKIAEDAFIKAGDVELARAAVKLAQLAGAQA